jgi:DNA-directed RNA polymerase specialized sigma24 family protein
MFGRNRTKPSIPPGATVVAADAAAMLEPELDSSDPSLTALVRAGDTDAYGRLYARHVESARRLARVLSDNPSDIDDLVAEAFVKVLATSRPTAAFNRLPERWRAALWHTEVEGESTAQVARRISDLGVRQGSLEIGLIGVVTSSGESH